MDARQICEKAAELVSGDRNKQHGDAIYNHECIAIMWNAYLKMGGIQGEVSASDVAAMMILLKLARVKTGSPNPDNFIDMAGYAGCMGHIELAPAP